MSQKQNIARRIKHNLSIKHNIKRTKVASGLVQTMIGGYRAATKIGAWQEPPRDILPKYIQAFCKSAAGAFGVEVVQVEPVPKTHALWASNHVSWMDIPVMGSVSPAFFLSKAEVEKMPVFGVLAKAAGTLFINRGSGDADTVANQISRFLQQGYSVIFYPEATTTDGKRIKKLHGKLLQAAIDADKPVQPIVVCYVNEKGELDETVPFYGITLKESLFRVIDSDLPVKAYVLPLEPLSPTGKTRSELTEELQQRMQSGLEELHSRVLNKG
ncbi:lysophospholipid acyltransferase family protein [Psychrobacter sp. FDAARGOS_221]|uniref:lysophospholipid acyltransferase family protein n=1 Tax=Psychrobacter sp. FDAARGOS_221 TaxID=1975705 RepID=UPI000BB57D98|nr:lysophospholipid acyltransferase family protein [Psychrobacter sp. FDAARGOS_221]PNK61293.1 1-acyl-sn-glycerol-3-phosphate acyltransferase [Psychrobacter sp. FDAARGOS_221]